MPKKLINSIYTIHRILGTLLSILFLIWFLSAFVMMYHSFPRITTEKIKQKYEEIKEPLPPIDSVLSRINANEKISQITLKREYGYTVFNIKTDKEEYFLPANQEEKAPEITEKYLHTVAHKWCKSPILKVDTLNELDQWIPHGQIKKELPVYKFSFDDSEKHELYLSSKSGKPLQFTTADARLWAWLGAIPHWVYFTQLRQHQTLWIGFIIGSCLLGCFMLISGFWIGLRTLKQARKKRKTFSPYRKKWYHWHYLTGMVFGITVFTFCFSGMMSIVQIPQWISKTTLSQDPILTLNAQPLLIDRTTDYREILNQYKDVREIEWKRLGNLSYFAVRSGKDKYYLNAKDKNLTPIRVYASDAENIVRSIHPNDRLTVTFLKHFETYYRDMSRMYKDKELLPVWKVEVENPEASCYYINPVSGDVKYVNRADRIKYWTYTALHRLRIQGLNSSPQLRKTILWILLLGGTAVSLSGVVLGVNYIRRKSRKIGSHRSNSYRR